MQTISNLFIRPHRDKYVLSDLGPKYFEMYGQAYYRKDFALRGARGKLECSWFKPQDRIARHCIVYCHGNCGSRLDASEVRDMALFFDYSVLAFDFGGCGHSEGDYVTLGFREQSDIEVVVDFLHETGQVRSIILWGRSMGAVAVLMHISQHKDFPVVVLDSPFSSLNAVVNDTVARYRFVPNTLKEFIMKNTRNRILKSAGFDILDIEPAQIIQGSTVPAVIIHSTDDEIINSQHSKDLFKAFNGAKFYVETNGHHNMKRHPGFIQRVINILEYFINLAPDFEDGNSTDRSGLPDLDESTKTILKSRMNNSFVE